MTDNKKTLTVSELTRQIKTSLESSFPHVWIDGEISNSKLHSSGHFYFTLKDEGAQISAVMWRSRVGSLIFNPEDGMQVLAKGSITVYPPRGNYQIDVVQLRPVGIGELQRAFERLKEKLAAEGLFDPERKKPLPEYPERIGVVTSEKGAALQDIRSIIERRFPSMEVIVYPVLVQGPGAAEEIAHAIREMNRYGGVDVMIVGRGGGSLEDLWAFNEEIVARAISASTIPIVSAVGHEVDFTIADFVADRRAPTPSTAAELVVPDRRDLIDILRNIHYTIAQHLQTKVENLRNRVKTLLSSYSFNRPRDLVLQFSQRADELDRSLTLVTSHFLERALHQHFALRQRLEALSLASVLKRGYAVVRKENQLISSANSLKAGDFATIEFHDGKVPAKIETV